MNFKDKIKDLKPYDLNCNVFDVYSYNGLSMQELLCQFFHKINDCIKISNDTIDLASWLVNEGLSMEVVNKLTLWLNDGTFEKIINDNIFNSLNNNVNSLNDKVDNLTSQVNSEIDILNSQLADIENITNKLAYVNDSMSTNEIKNIINSNNIIIFEKGDFYIEPLELIGVTNKKIIFSSGVKIMPSHDLSDEQSMIKLLNCSDVELKGVLNIDLLKHYNKGEQRHCLRIEYSNNIYIDTINGRFASGDCLCLIRSNNIFIKNVKSYNSARSGVVICSGENINIDLIDCYNDIESWLGYSSALHIEPFENDILLKSINIKNVILKNSKKDITKYGVCILLLKRSDFCSINIGNVCIEDCYYPIRFAHKNGHDYDLKGFIDIDNLNVLRCDRANIMNWFEGESPKLTIKKSTFIDCNLIDYQHSDQGLYFIESSREGVIGNMDLGTITYNGGNVYRIIYFNTHSSGSVSNNINYNILFNQELKECSGSPAFSPTPIFIKNGIADYTKLRNCPATIKNHNVGTEIDSIRGFASEINNHGMTRTSFIWLAFSKVGSKMKFCVKSPYYLQINIGEGDILLPDYSNTKLLKSSVVGSHIVIEKVDNNTYAIIEQVGVWEVVNI